MNDLQRLAAEFGSCGGCGFPAIDLCTGAGRVCEDCKAPVCDVGLTGTDCGPATGDALCWGCYHARRGES